MITVSSRSRQRSTWDRLVPAVIIDVESFRKALQGDGTPDTFEAIRDGGEWPISLEFLAPRVAAVLQHEDVNAIPRSASSPNSATAPGNGKP